MQAKVGQQDLRAITTAAHIWTIFVPVAERTLETFKLQTRRIYQTNCFPLKMIRDTHLRIFSIACLQNSETEIIVCSDH